MKIHAVGGYSEVGRNMTALELGEKTGNSEILVFDCGLYLPPLVELEDGRHTAVKLHAVGALPDDHKLREMKDQVKAFLISHAHLDHVGAIPYIAGHYKAPIYGTPFTIEVLNSILKDNSHALHNKKIKVNPNSSVTVGREEYEVEFVNITHSTLQSTLIVVYTDKGAVVYANDFKFDNSPILGKKPDYHKLEKIGNEGVRALVMESLYAHEKQKTPSEKIVKDMLEDVMLHVNNQNSAVLVTTFSSHIARLSSIVEFGKKLDRKIIFLGRSLYKYTTAAARAKLINFHKEVELLTFKQKIKKRLREIEQNREKYLIVCTGHQGEKGSVLVRIANDSFPFHLKSKDHVIFSSKTIPAPINIANRKELENKLKDKGAKIFTDVHVSGHASREDLRYLIELLRPQNLIPAHGDLDKLTNLAELGTEMDYKVGKNLHILQNGRAVEL